MYIGCIYWKALKKAAITYINDIINKTNGHFMSHDELQEKYNIKTYHIDTLQIHSHLPLAISSSETIYNNFKNKDDRFWKTIFKMNFICSRQTTIQTFQYKIIYRILAYNEWLNNIKIKICNTCSFCNDKDTISHFLIDCNSIEFFLGKGGSNGGKP